MSTVVTDRSALITSLDLNGDGVIDEKEMRVALSLLAPVDRERLTNDLMNTSVMSALIGGFALGSLSAPEEGSESITTWIYMLSYCTVHMCTCSALSSAFIYAAVNRMDDDCVGDWAKNQKKLLMLPMMKFVMGCMAYMLSVILTSWRDLGDYQASKVIALIVGAGSVSSVWMVYLGVEMSIKKHETKPGSAATDAKKSNVASRKSAAKVSPISPEPSVEQSN